MANIGTYMLRRVLLLIPLLIGLSIVMFALIHLAPGDPALAFISEQNSSADFIEQTRRNMGLDKPLPVQYAIALVVALLIAIPVGIISATRQYSLLDNTTTIASFLGLALPNFWLALLL